MDSDSRNLEENIKVLKSRDQDIPALRELFLSVRIATFVREDPSRFALSDFDRETRDEFIFVALADENIVGFVSVWPADPIEM